MNFRQNALTYKGYGRVYVDQPENVSKVLDIIRSMDAEEFETYMPKELVAPFSEYPRLVYTGKFDLNMQELTARCWQAGIYVWVADNGKVEHLPSLQPLTTPSEADLP